MLPAHPGAAYWVLRQSAADYEPITFDAYWRAVDRIPQNSIAEIDSSDPIVNLIVLDRLSRLARLRARWLLSRGNHR